MLKEWRNTGKFRGLEVLFFFLLFFLFPIVTDIEYRINEQPCQGCERNFSVSLLERLISGFFSLWPWVFFYHFILNKFLLVKKYGYFLLATIFFVLLLEYYTVYVFYWTVSQMKFLPESIVSAYSRYYRAEPFFHFSIVYVITRMFIFMALAYYIQTSRQEQHLRIVQNQKLESDLKYLKAQMEPHFFFNTLNNLYSLALQGSTETAPLIARLSDLMRYVIYESKNDCVPLEKEIDFIKNYIAVHRIRYRASVDIQFEVQNLPAGFSIQPMLLLPFFENAFKHGMEDELGKGFLRGTIEVQDGQLLLELSNSMPVTSSKMPSEAGIGLDNTKQKLDLLYPKQYDLKSECKDNTYFVSLKLILGV